MTGRRKRLAPPGYAAGTMADPSKPASDTKQRIMDAAIEVLKTEGINGASARQIAQRGGFNQALIFYHFGSVNGLLIQAAQRNSQSQVAKYREAAADVASLQDLVGIARRLHHDDLQEGSVAVVTQMMAGSANDPEMAAAMLEAFERWIQLVEDGLGDALEGSPLAGMLPKREAAYAISAMFLGIELMSRLDPDSSEADALFDMMAGLAATFEGLFPALGGGA